MAFISPLSVSAGARPVLHHFLKAPLTRTKPRGAEHAPFRTPVTSLQQPENRQVTTPTSQPTMRALYADPTIEPITDISTVYGDLSIFHVGEFPAPAPPAADEVLVAVHAAALNPIDIRRGTLFDSTFPVLVGYDVAGVVVTVGDSVRDLAIGDRVMGDVMRNPLGPKITGSTGEQVLCETELLARIPDGISFVQAAAVPLVAMTAIQVLRLAGMHPGAKLFVSGGAGGVGIHLIQIAKRMFGASRVATSCSSAKIDLVKKYGADIAVDYCTLDVGEELAGWADVVVDTVKDFDTAKKVCAENGKVATVVARDDPDIPMCILNTNKEDLEATVGMLSDGSLVPVIDSIFSLKDSLRALDRQGSGRAVGKIVIKILDS